MKSFLYSSRSPECAHRKDHNKTTLFPKWVHSETEKLVPTQTEQSITEQSRAKQRQSQIRKPVHHAKGFQMLYQNNTEYQNRIRQFTHAEHKSQNIFLNKCTTFHILNIALFPDFRNHMTEFSSCLHNACQNIFFSFSHRFHE